MTSRKACEDYRVFDVKWTINLINGRTFDLRVVVFAAKGGKCCCVVPQIGKFSLSLAASATAMFQSHTGCHVCGKKASRKCSLYMQKKKFVLVGAAIRRLSEVKHQKVRLGRLDATSSHNVRFSK